MPIKSILRERGYMSNEIEVMIDNEQYYIARVLGWSLLFYLLYMVFIVRPKLDEEKEKENG